MTLLVTGGTGFVMSVLVRAWLERDPAARVVILDRAAPDAMTERFFAPVRDRVRVITADICDPSDWAPQLSGEDIRQIVHGATVTPISRGTPSHARSEPEARDPARIMEINFTGTLRLLDWARQLPDLARFIFVSSGSVYRHHGPDQAGEPLPEDGYVAPLTLYGISKFASEMTVDRYADLFGLSAVSVRLASVYGPMDRVTASRNFRHVPNRIAHMALAGEIIRPNSLEPVGDYIQSRDVASAILALLDAPRLRYRHYNIASGETATIGDLIGWARQRLPALEVSVTDGPEANVVHDVALRDGMWGAYDIARITRDTGWQPRPGPEAFHDYLDWISGFETCAAPSEEMN